MGWPALHSNHCHCQSDDVGTSSSIIPKHKLKFPFVQKQILNWPGCFYYLIIRRPAQWTLFLSLSIVRISIYSLTLLVWNLYHGTPCTYWRANNLTTRWLQKLVPQTLRPSLSILIIFSVLVGCARTGIFYTIFPYIFTEFHFCCIRWKPFWNLRVWNWQAVEVTFLAVAPNYVW
jgi:hypothetical protein